MLFLAGNTTFWREKSWLIKQIILSNLIKFNMGMCKSCTWRRSASGTSICWGPPNWNAVWQKRTWGPLAPYGKDLPAKWKCQKLHIQVWSLVAGLGSRASHTEQPPSLTHCLRHGRTFLVNFKASAAFREGDMGRWVSLEGTDKGLPWYSL